MTVRKPDVSAEKIISSYCDFWPDSLLRGKGVLGPEGPRDSSVSLPRVMKVNWMRGAVGRLRLTSNFFVVYTDDALKISSNCVRRINNTRDPSSLSETLRRGQQWVTCGRPTPGPYLSEQTHTVRSLRRNDHGDPWTMFMSDR